MANLRLMGVCLDCADARELADFYVRLLGWEIRGGDGAGWISIGDPTETVHLNIQAEEWYEPPVWPERAGRAAQDDALRDPRRGHGGRRRARGGRGRDDRQPSTCRS